MPVAIATTERDITEKNRTEQDLRHKESQLRQLEKSLREHTEVLIQASRRKDEFLAMLAHELRNPVAPLLNAVQVLESTGGETKLVFWASAMIKRQVGYLPASSTICWILPVLIKIG